MLTASALKEAYPPQCLARPEGAFLAWASLGGEQPCGNVEYRYGKCDHSKKSVSVQRKYDDDGIPTPMIERDGARRQETCKTVPPPPEAGSRWLRDRSMARKVTHDRAQDSGSLIRPDSTRLSVRATIRRGASRVHFLQALRQ